MSSLLEVGDEITCPECERVMLRCIEVPTIGMRGYARCFENVDWLGGAYHQTRCNYCPGEWATRDDIQPLRVHVKDKGWIF